MTNLSPETLERLEWAKTYAPQYAPSLETEEEIKDRALIELIAPAGEGKSTIAQLAKTLDPDFSVVTGFTTKEREERDAPGRYTYFNTDLEIAHLLDRIDEGGVLQYTVFPTTGNIYGSFPEDYHTPYSILETLSNNVAEIDKLPFEAIYKVAVVSRANEWEERFLKRYPVASEERTKRLGEAILCLRWIVSQDPELLIWLENASGEVGAAAKELVALTKNELPTQNLQLLARRMLETAENIAA